MCLHLPVGCDMTYSVAEASPGTCQVAAEYFGFLDRVIQRRNGASKQGGLEGLTDIVARAERLLRSALEHSLRYNGTLESVSDIRKQLSVPEGGAEGGEEDDGEEVEEDDDEEGVEGPDISPGNEASLGLSPPSIRSPLLSRACSSDHRGPREAPVS